MNDTKSTIRHMTPEEVAARLSITERTLKDWLKKGTGPRAMQLGERTVRYAEADVLAYEAACRRNGGK